jgi:RHS repeat-associated protein
MGAPGASHLGTWDIDTMQAQTSIRVPDTSTPPPFACLFSEASSDPSISTSTERDTESGNDYFGARYYASSMGRFMSPDWSVKEEPIRYAKLDDPQSLNLYAYVRNHPLTRVDEDGHDGCCDVSIPMEEPGMSPPSSGGQASRPSMETGYFVLGSIGSCLSRCGFLLKPIGLPE